VGDTSTSRHHDYIITANQFGSIISIDNLLRFAGSKVSADNRLKYQGFDLAKARDEAEKLTIIRAIKACRGNKTQAAQLLGLSRSALYYKIKQLQIPHLLDEPKN
jgi:transcriptional regulator of acetoin/glycerol metabolism